MLLLLLLLLLLQLQQLLFARGNALALLLEEGVDVVAHLLVLAERRLGEVAAVAALCAADEHRVHVAVCPYTALCGW